MSEKKVGLGLCRHQAWFQIRPTAARTLRRFMAKENSRYAINHVNVSEDAITVTDGRRLLSIATEHGITPGNYTVTLDGWFVGPMEVGNFPKWKDLVIKPAEAKTVWSGSLYEYGASVVLWAINRKADTAVNLDLWLPAINGLRDLGADQLTVYRYRRQKQDGVIQIRGELGKESFTFLHMPLNVSRQ
jgi:hypothetical protein